MTDKKDEVLTPFEIALQNSKHFAINMYTFYLFQKSCNELIMSDTYIRQSLSAADTEEEVEKLMEQFDKNEAAWNMIMLTDALSGSVCYAEA